jgi:hypothetical protein
MPISVSGLMPAELKPSRRDRITGTGMADRIQLNTSMTGFRQNPGEVVF